MKSLNYLNQYRRKQFGFLGNEYEGFFIIPLNKDVAYQVKASNGSGWDHVSVSIANFRDLKGFTPSWTDMHNIGKLFFEPSEICVEIFPKEEDYVNDTDYVLHLWRATKDEMPMPNLNDIPQVPIDGEIIQTGKNQFIKTEVFENDEWKFVSVEACSKSGGVTKRYPLWNEMCTAKDRWFDKDQAAIQIHDQDDKKMHPQTERNKYKLYICMPLTKELPLPDPFMVGLSRKYEKKKALM